jgi:GntR family transcriptional regulator, arabinose operon transcriptional repressor
MKTSANRRSKHADVYSALRRQLQSGRWQPGDRIPSEAELVQQFGVSRITVGRAVKDLRADGLVERRRGAGTFVRRKDSSGQLSFGLLIPDLGDTEIFEPICQGMMASPLAREHMLLWGSAMVAGSSKEERAWTLCRQFIERSVSGVFFAPLELSHSKDELNRRIGNALDSARIPIVLLDRGLLPYPQPGRHDLVGLDNHRAGYAVTEHLLQLGTTRIAFVGPENAASTVDEREAGYREALYALGAPLDRRLVRRIDPDDDEAVKELMHAPRPDGVVCANDRTAGRLMHSLRRLEYRVPQDVRLVGIDDVDYAALLPVPLTTVRQPTQQIGDAALEIMLSRIARPHLPARHTQLHGELIVRESSGVAVGDRMQARGER